MKGIVYLFVQIPNHRAPNHQFTISWDFASNFTCVPRVFFDFLPLDLGVGLTVGRVDPILDDFVAGTQGVMTYVKKKGSPGLGFV